MFLNASDVYAILIPIIVIVLLVIFLCQWDTVRVQPSVVLSKHVYALGCILHNLSKHGICVRHNTNRTEYALIKVMYNIRCNCSILA